MRMKVSFVAALLTVLCAYSDPVEVTSTEKGGHGETYVSFTLRPTPVSNIRCILTLPDKAKWDGRFWGVGNGGWAGSVSRPNMGNSAALACDLGTSGHPREKNPANIEMIRDFCWRATHLATLEAKRMIREFYGREPEHSYFIGASTGGGQGLCEAQRYPEDYDGVIAEVPGNDRLSRATPLWQAARLRRKHGGKWFSKEERRKIREAELAYFATFEPEWAHNEFIVDPLPTKEKLDGCWREIVKRNPQLADREALWRELFEPVCVGGRRLESGQLIGIEFDMPWTFLLEKFIGPRKPEDVTEEELLAFADNPEHRFVNPDLSAFRKRGGKIIMYVGLEDLSVPPRAVNDYYDAVVKKNGGLEKTREFFVHYLIPGRAHAPAGKATGRPEELREKLIAWVERGEKPGDILVPWRTKAPRKLRIGPYPENRVTCEFMPPQEAAELNWRAAWRFVRGETGEEMTKKDLHDRSGFLLTSADGKRRWKMSSLNPRQKIAIFEERNGVWRKVAYVSAIGDAATSTLTIKTNRSGDETVETLVYDPKKPQL